MENKLISISFILAALTILILSLVKPVSIGAQYYGEGQLNKSITVDKKVRSLTDKEYFDNIAASKKVFFEGDIVEFSIAIENSGNQTLENISVVDTLPRFLNLIFNPGTFNKDNNTITWTIDKLNAGETKNFLIRGKINESGLNSTSQTILMTNSVEAKKDNISDSDSASYFIGVSTVPRTGDTSLPVKTLILLSTGVTGLYIRKFARGY